MEFSIDDMKRQLQAWAENERIPGKFQAWFTKEALPENSDWRFVAKKVGEHTSLTLEAPAKGMEAPDVVCFFPKI